MDKDYNPNLIPEIFTTGKEDPSISFRTIDEELYEIVRGPFGNQVAAASDWITLGKPEGSIENLCRLGVDYRIASIIVEAAINRIPEVGIRLKTVFLSGIIGGEREYRDFQFFNHSKPKSKPELPQ